ncbi:hypothetical protein DFJ73DRAFT_961833 [Zopfochytrium polystomum]|nr:hypothetical protein DFJ73DRAFT_961833 [Zopfochytrium polystomum]
MSEKALLEYLDPSFVWPLWHDGIKHLRSAYPLALPIIHAVFVSYVYRKHTPDALLHPKRFDRRATLNPTLRGLLLVLLIGLGGGSTAAILTGRPLPIFLHPHTLLIYAGAFILTSPLHSLLTLLAPLLAPIFDVVDALIRAQSLASTIDALRLTLKQHSTKHHYTVDDLLIQTWLLATISVTAGGILWRWGFATVAAKKKRPTGGPIDTSDDGMDGAQSHPFKYPGWDFNTVAVAAAVYLANTPLSGRKETPFNMFLESILQLVTLGVAQSRRGASNGLPPAAQRIFDLVDMLRTGLRYVAEKLGMPTNLKSDDWVLIAAAIMAIGFITRPSVAAAPPASSPAKKSNTATTAGRTDTPKKPAPEKVPSAKNLSDSVSKRSTAGKSDSSKNE